MTYFQNATLAVPGHLLIKSDDNPAGLMSKGIYDRLVNQAKIKQLRRASKGCSSLIEFESLPEIYKAALHEMHGGDVYGYMAKQPIRDLIEPDYTARRFFDSFELPNGNTLEPELRKRYSNDAAILNAFKKLLSDKRKLKETLKVTLAQFWQTAGSVIKDVSRQYPNKLPVSERHLKPLYKNYMQDGYEALIDKRLFNKSNNTKVTADLEHLILSIYVRNKCFIKEAYADYLRFINGKLQLMDTKTAELFVPENYFVNGKPDLLSESTVYRYVNKPSNRPKVDSIRVSSLEYNSRHRPHMHRHAPVYSLSKITMDDIAIPFKMHDGKRVWAYQIFDVASGCVIGKAFGRSNDEGSGKDRALFMRAIVDMFRLMAQNSWGVPAQIEVEQHISNTFADDLLNQGYIFPFVRFCRGGNPQEKRAENNINGKKYAMQHQRPGFQGRHYAHREAFRLNQDTDKTRYTFDEIVANELQDIATWNHSAHPKHPGKTRWQILSENINPVLHEPDTAMLSYFIGEQSPTHIVRNQYVRVKRVAYALPSVEVIERLNHTSLTAHYIPEGDTTISAVHLYQNGKFICTCTLMETFNEAMAERTDDDTAIMQRQFAYRSGYDKWVKDGVDSLAKLTVLDTEKLAKSASKMQDKHPQTTPFIANKIINKAPVNWAEQAINDL